MHDDYQDSHYPQDQAHGLRRLFAHSRVRMVPVVANPHMAFGGVLLERLCTAFAEQGAQVMVVDASDTAPEPSELAVMDLGSCIETLSPKVHYIAARGLPLRHVDATGSTGDFLKSLAEAAPHVDVMLVHATESDLCRLFMRSDTRPLLLADDRPTSVTHAYAAMKLLTQRAGLAVYDLLLCAAPTSPRAERISVQLAACADDFLGVVLREKMRVDPASDVRDPPSSALRRWAREVMNPTPSSPYLGAGSAAQVRASLAQHVLN